MESNHRIVASNTRRSGPPPKLFGFSLTPLASHRPVTRPTKQRMEIQCRFCARTFFNSQSYGGHQNAHKKERQEIRRIRQQLPQKMLVSRPLFVQPPPSQPPSGLSMSPPTSHAETRWEDPNPSTNTRVCIKEASDSAKENCFPSSSTSTCREYIHVESGDANSLSTRMEEGMNVDLRL